MERTEKKALPGVRVGTKETVRSRVRAYAESGIDVCVINPIADASGVVPVLDDIAGSLDGLDLRNGGVVRATA